MSTVDFRCVAYLSLFEATNRMTPYALAIASLAEDISVEMCPTIAVFLTPRRRAPNYN